MLDTPVPLIIVIVLFLAAAGWAVVTNRNKHVRHLLTQGWSPLFIAMAISTGTGIVLDTFVERYSGFALLAVVIAGMPLLPHIFQDLFLTFPSLCLGLPGGTSAIFVSRLSTALHAAMPRIPTESSASLTEPADIEPKHDERHHPSTRLTLLTLIAVSVPVEMAFLGCVTAVGWINLPFVFVALQIAFFLIAVRCSLPHAQSHVLGG